MGPSTHVVHMYSHIQGLNKSCFVLFCFVLDLSVRPDTLGIKSRKQNTSTIGSDQERLSKILVAQEEIRSTINK